MKKVLVLNGSPRANGNTRVLSEAFITRCIQRSYEVKKYNIPDLNINPCTDCGKCFSNNKPCIIEDDFNEYLKNIMAYRSILGGSSSQITFGNASQ